MTDLIQREQNPPTGDLPAVVPGGEPAAEAELATSVVISVVLAAIGFGGFVYGVTNLSTVLDGTSVVAPVALLVIALLTLGLTGAATSGAAEQSAMAAGLDWPFIVGGVLTVLAALLALTINRLPHEPAGQPEAAASP